MSDVVDPLVNPDEIPPLTEEQKSHILKEWNTRPQNPPSIPELIELVWGDKKGDSRSRKGRIIKEFLTTRNMPAIAPSNYVPKGLIDLTEEQKTFINQNHTRYQPLELTREIFKNDKLMPLSQEAKTIFTYLKSLEKPKEKLPYIPNQNPVIEKILTDEPELERPEDNIKTPKDWRSPKSENRAIVRINRYVKNGIDPEKLTPVQRKSCRSLMNYMETFRFTSQIKTYENFIDQDLFESEFVRCCYDKPDLAEEEVDQYIIYATEVVMGMNTIRRINEFNKKHDEEIRNNGKINMGMVEAVKGLKQEYDECVNRQNKLLNDLKVSRSKKQEKMKKDNASILNLVALWKEETTRKELIEAAKLHKTTLKDELKRLASLDEIRVRLLGLDVDDLQE